MIDFDIDSVWKFLVYKRVPIDPEYRTMKNICKNNILKIKPHFFHFPLILFYEFQWLN